MRCWSAASVQASACSMQKQTGHHKPIPEHEALSRQCNTTAHGNKGAKWMEGTYLGTLHLP